MPQNNKFLQKTQFQNREDYTLTVTAVTAPSSYANGLSILYSAIYKSFIETMKGEIRAGVKEIKQKINIVTKNQATARIMSF